MQRCGTKDMAFTFTVAKVFKNKWDIGSVLLYKKKIVRVNTFWKPLLKSVLHLLRWTAFTRASLPWLIESLSNVTIYYQGIKGAVPIFYLYKIGCKLKVLERGFIHEI